MTLDLTLLPQTVVKTVLYGTNALLDLGPVLEADDVTIQFAFVDAAGDPVDVSGWTGRTFSAFDSSGAQAFTLSPAFDSDGTDGLVNVNLSNTELDGLGGEDYSYEMQVTGTGIKATPVRGGLAVTATYI